MSLQRMIVIPPDTFERWKNIVVEDKKLSELDREMRKILYDNKLNTISKWYHYRQNLLKYLNTNRKRHIMHNFNTKKQITNVDTQTKIVNYKNKMAQTLPINHHSVGTQVKLMKTLEEIPSLEEVFGNSNQFSSLEEEGNYDETTGENDLIELDVDDIVRTKALEGQPNSVKIIKERKSMDPNEYRVFELNTGEQINVPVEKQMITRATLKRGRLPDTTQTLLAFPHKKKTKSNSTSTPMKSQNGGKTVISWKKL